MNKTYPSILMEQVLWKQVLYNSITLCFVDKVDGINVYIICIVTLFLAEYCGFGWVVGTFVWIFWFCFRNRLKMLYFHFLKVRLKICRGSSSAKFQLLSQIHNIQPKITSLYIWYTRLCHHLCNKLPCYIVIWKSRSKCVFQYSTKKIEFFFSKNPSTTEIFQVSQFSENWLKTPT